MGLDKRGMRSGGLDARLAAAVVEGRVEAARKLLAEGADPNHRETGAAPLLAQAAFALSVWKGSARARAREIFEALLGGGADPNGVDEMGRSCLHLAVFYGQEEAALILIEKGARVDAVDAGGCSAAHYLALAAGRGGDVAPMAGILSAAGADFDLKNRVGESARSLALRGGYDRSERVMAAVSESQSLAREIPERSPGAQERKKPGL